MASSLSNKGPGCRYLIQCFVLLSPRPWLSLPSLPSRRYPSQMQPANGEPQPPAPSRHCQLPLTSLSRQQLNTLARVQLLVSQNLNRLRQQRLHVRVEARPVRVLQVIFLALVVASASSRSTPLRELPARRGGEAPARAPGATYRLVLEALDDGELARIVDVLHDVPVDGLAVVAVYAAGFDELALELFDGRGVVFDIGVADERVDHADFCLLYRMEGGA